MRIKRVFKIRARAHLLMAIDNMKIDKIEFIPIEEKPLEDCGKDLKYEIKITGLLPRFVLGNDENIHN